VWSKNRCLHGGGLSAVDDPSFSNNDLKDKDAQQVRKSLDAVVGGLSLDDEAFICRFDQFFHPGAGFTADHDVLLTELQRTKIDSQPSTSPPGGAIANAPSINGIPPLEIRPI